MLVLSRRPDESLVIDGVIRITILSGSSRTIRLGIDAPRSVSIVRSELLDPLPPKYASCDVAPDAKAIRQSGK